jgi:anti-sigma regulatory factor (Ser/Thr protein kinase)
MVTDPETLELSVPANAEYLATARLFAAAAARHLSAHEDAVEDLLLAVSEASTFVLQRSPSPAALRVDLRPLQEGLAVRIHTAVDTGIRADPHPAEPAERAVPGGTAPPEDSQGAAPIDRWGPELLQALVDDLAFQTHPDGQLEAAFVFAFDRASSGDDDGARMGAAEGERSRPDQG